MAISRYAFSLRDRLRPSPVGPIGIDLGHRSVQLVQLELAEGGARLRAASSLPYPGDDASVLHSPKELGRLLTRALRRSAFRGRRVVSAIPADRVKLMLLHYELGPEQSEPDEILSLIEERTDETLEGCVIDYLPLRENPDQKGETSALVAVAREEAVIAHLELLRSAGLKVDALEIAPVALRRLLRELAEDPPRENVLAIHFGPERSYLLVLWGRRLILYREIAFGASGPVEALARSLDMTHSEARSLLGEYGLSSPPESEPPETPDARTFEIRRALVEIARPSFRSVAEQVASALVYTASRTRGESVDAVYILGGVAAWPGVEPFLAELLSMPVRVLDPLLGLGAEAEAATGAEPSSDLALAAGLALRGHGRGD